MTTSIEHPVSLLAKLRGLRLSRRDGRWRLTWPVKRVLEGDVYADGKWVTRRSDDAPVAGLLEYRVLPGQTVGGEAKA